jgi:hypothetical protein
LLEATPTYLAWQAEELLHWASLGRDPNPYGSRVGPGGEWAKKCRVAWEKWWRERNESFDFTAIVRQPRRPFLFTVRVSDAVAPGFPFGYGFGPEGFGSDGWPRLDFRFLGFENVEQFLPNGRMLVSPPFDVKNGGTIVREIDWSGEVRREFRTPWSVLPRFLLERLSDGRTHIMAGNGGYHLLVDENGVLVFPVGRKEPFLEPGEFRQEPERPESDTVKLPGGNRMVLQPSRNRIVEFDRTGREVGETHYYRFKSEGSRLRILFPQLRLGFDDLPGRDYDLRTSLDERIRQLDGPYQGDWYLAVKAIAADFKSQKTAVLPKLVHVYGKCLSQSDGGGEVQNEILRALRAISPDPIGDVAKLADSTDQTARIAVNIILGRIDEWDDEQLDLRCAVLKRALRDPSASVRRSAAYSASIFHNREAEVLPLLKELLKDDAISGPDNKTVGDAAKQAISSLAYMRERFSNQTLKQINATVRDVNSNQSSDK